MRSARRKTAAVDLNQSVALDRASIFVETRAPGGAIPQRPAAEDACANRKLDPTRKRDRPDRRVGWRSVRQISGSHSAAGRCPVIASVLGDRVLGTLLLLAHLVRHPVRRGGKLSVRERLAMLPRKGLPIRTPVRIHWDEHQIPFIEAETDDDLAVVLGMVHAHLRLGQIEMMRRLSQGRVAEMIGPLGVQIDRLVRTLDVARAVPQIEREMPAETRCWLEGFVRGLNHYIAEAETLPHEFRIFGLGREPWSSFDVLALGRFLSSDVNWIVWLPLLGLRGNLDWPSLWRRLLNHDVVSPEARESERHARPLPFAGALGAMLRSGSNSFAISAAKSASGAPLLATDPHLSLFLPNAWVIAGMKSRSHHAVGLMIPGLPVIALGRNPWIAWGGTSLHAASSEFVALPADEEIVMHERTETLAVRWSRGRKIRIRESPWGPVITDIPGLRSSDALALRWIGHRPSDEMTAMLRVNRARDWAHFRAALEGFAVPGQRMLYADVEGRIGHLMATHLPRRTGSAAADLAVPAADAAGWEARITSTGLPSRLDPPEGFITSANERPDAGDVLVGFHFSPPDRKRRLDQILSGTARVSVDGAAKMQRDVQWTTALVQRDMFLAWLGAGRQRRNPRQANLIADLSAWDGSYGAESRGALAFELISYHLARRLIGLRQRKAYAASWATRGLIWQDVLSAAPEKRQRALRAALRAAARAITPQATWGRIHRLCLGHPLMMIPLVGRAYRVADLPAAGSSETLMKTAHPLTGKRHASQYGSCARHISDLADANRNSFVLLGGQDGWWGSSTFADQVALWQRGEYISVPLMPETVRAAFPYRTELTP